MAAKSKAKAAPKVTAKAKAAPKGLQLSSAQWKAYSKAASATSKAAYQKLALNTAAQRFRKYRLQAAYATIAKSNIAASNARTAAIAAFAARQSLRQSRLGHQNAALRARIGADAQRHTTIAGRLQYVQAGQAKYAHRAVMRTVDTNQALSYEKAIFAQAAKAAKVAAKSVSGKGGKAAKVSPKVQAQIAAQAQAAGIKAAKATKSRAAPCKGFLPTALFDGTSNYWILGLNDFEGTCIMAAVANALWRQTGWRLPDTDIAYWTGRAGKRPTIMGVLHMLYRLQPWPEVEMLLPMPAMPDEPVAKADRIIGWDDHAAYAFGDNMVSYGAVWPVVKDVEEIWAIWFQAR